MMWQTLERAKTANSRGKEQIKMPNQHTKSQIKLQESQAEDFEKKY